MIFGEHIVPQSEMIKAILFEDSPCCGGSHLEHEEPADVDRLEGAQSEVVTATFFVLSQSEVIRAILLEESPCCGVPHPERCSLRDALGVQLVDPWSRLPRLVALHWLDVRGGRAAAAQLA